MQYGANPSLRRYVYRSFRRCQVDTPILRELFRFKLLPTASVLAQDGDVVSDRIIEQHVIVGHRGLFQRQCCSIGSDRDRLRCLKRSGNRTESTAGRGDSNTVPFSHTVVISDRSWVAKVVSCGS